MESPSGNLGGSGTLASIMVGSQGSRSQHAVSSAGLHLFIQTHNLESKKQFKKEFASARMVKFSEVQNKFSTKQLVQEVLAEIYQLKANIAVLIQEGEHTSNRLADNYREVYDRIKKVVKVLHDKHEISSRLQQVYEEAVDLSQVCIFSQSLTKNSVLELAGFELLELVSTQTEQEQVSNKILNLAMEYLKSDAIHRYSDPSAALSYSSYLSNSISNSLLGSSTSNLPPAEMLKQYFDFVLSLVSLRKSSQYCIISLRLTRNILLRYSLRNPRNKQLDVQAIETCTNYLQSQLRVDELIEYSLKYACLAPTEHMQILSEILWTIAFAQKYYDGIVSIYKPSLFTQLTGLVFGDLDLIKIESVALPYLSYLSGIIAVHDIANLNQFTQGENMKILNSLTAVLQNESCHRVVRREALLAISNYLAKEADISCAEVIANVLISQQMFIEDSFYFKEVIYILFSYMQACITHGNFQAQIFHKSVDYVKSRMQKIDYSVEELQSITSSFELVMKVLRQEQIQEIDCNTPLTGILTNSKYSFFMPSQT